MSSEFPAAQNSDPNQDAADGLPPLYGIAGVTLRELVLVGVWALLFLVSFFPLYAAVPASIWATGISWLLTVAVPTVAVFLIVLRRFSPHGIRRVGSLGIDQFASVAMSVSFVSWLGYLVQAVAASAGSSVSLLSWAVVVELLLAAALVALTVFAPFLPRMRDDFLGRPEAVAHTHARAVRQVVARPRPVAPVVTEAPAAADAAAPGEAVTPAAADPVALDGAVLPGGLAAGAGVAGVAGAAGVAAFAGADASSGGGILPRASAGDEVDEDLDATRPVQRWTDTPGWSGDNSADVPTAATSEPVAEAAPVDDPHVAWAPPVPETAESVTPESANAANDTAAWAPSETVVEPEIAGADDQAAGADDLGVADEADTEVPVEVEPEAETAAFVPEQDAWVPAPEAEAEAEAPRTEVEAPVQEHDAWAPATEVEAPVQEHDAWAPATEVDAPVEEQSAWAPAAEGEAPVEEHDAWAPATEVEAPVEEHDAWAPAGPIAETPTWAPADADASAGAAEEVAIDTPEEAAELHEAEDEFIAEGAPVFANDDAADDASVDDTVPAWAPHDAEEPIHQPDTGWAGEVSNDDTASGDTARDDLPAHGDGLQTPLAAAVHQDVLGSDLADQYAEDARADVADDVADAADWARDDHEAPGEDTGSDAGVDTWSDTADAPAEPHADEAEDAPTAMIPTVSHDGDGAPAAASNEPVIAWADEVVGLPADAEPAVPEATPEHDDASDEYADEYDDDDDEIVSSEATLTEQIAILGFDSQVPTTSHASGGSLGIDTSDSDDIAPAYSRRSRRQQAETGDVFAAADADSDELDATIPRTSAVTEPVPGPFWALAPTERDVFDAGGNPIFRVGPTEWTLVIEDRGGAYVVRHDDGRIGYLHDVDDMIKG